MAHNFTVGPPLPGFDDVEDYVGGGPLHAEPLAPIYSLRIDWNRNGLFDHPNSYMTADLIEGSFWRGITSISNILPQGNAGTLQFRVLNDNGQYSVNNIASPIYGLLSPYITVQVMAVWPLVMPLWTGKLQGISTLTGIPPVAVIIADGVLLELADQQNIVDPAPLDNTTPGAVIDYILTAAGFTSGRTLDAGIIPIGAWYEAGVALSLIASIVDTEVGRFYEDRNGGVIFESRYHRNYNPSSIVSQATFSDIISDTTFRISELQIGGDELKTIFNYIETKGAQFIGTDPAGYTVLWRTSGNIPPILPGASIQLNATPPQGAAYVEDWQTVTLLSPTGREAITLEKHPTYCIITIRNVATNLVANGAPGTAPVNTAGWLGYPGVSGTVNIIPNSSFEVNTAGWATGTSFVRSSDFAKFGTYSGKFVTPSTAFQLAAAVTLVPSTRYTGSVWCYSPAGITISLSIGDTVDFAQTSGNFTIPAGVWTRVVYTQPLAGDAHTSGQLTITPQNAGTLYIDGVQLEAGLVATAYSGTIAGIAIEPSTASFRFESYQAADYVAYVIGGLTIGATYTISGLIWNNAGTTVVLRFADALGTPIVPGVPVVGINDWVPVVFTYVCGTATVELRVENGGGATPFNAWFKEIQVEPGNVMTPNAQPYNANIIEYEEVSITGRAAIIQNQQNVLRKDDASILKYHKRQNPLPGRWYSNFNYADTSAVYFIDTHKNPSSNVQRFAFMVEDFNTFIQAVLREIGDRITIIANGPQARLGLTGNDYIIESIEYNLSNPSASKPTLLETIWTLTPAQPVTHPWILGDVVYGILGTTTVLGY